MADDCGRLRRNVRRARAAVVDDAGPADLAREGVDKLAEIVARFVCRDDRDDGGPVSLGFGHAGTDSTTPSSRPSQSAMDAKLRSNAGRASAGASRCHVTWFSRRTPAARSAFRSTRPTNASP